MAGLSAKWERWYPIGAGATSLIVVYLFGDSLIAAVGQKRINAQALYGAVFNWAAIQAGFTVGIYALLVGHAGEFITRIKGTAAFERFLGYIENAAVASFVLATLTVPMIALEPDIVRKNSVGFISFSVWLALFVTTFLAFVRVARIFVIISRVRDRQEYSG